MEALGILFMILIGLLFNPIVWVIVAVVVVIRDRRKKKQAPAEPADDEIVRDEFGALRLEELARLAKNGVERSLLLRAAQALRLGLPALPVDHTAPTAQRADGISKTSTEPIKPVEPASTSQKPTEPEEPLAERGLKALQNINILLYLGAFFIVVAAGVFIGSTYGSLSDATKVLLLGLFAAAFYITGLVLYALTTRIRPAGVTFTAIGLLIAPLVGVAAQTLLYADKNPGPIWLVTSIVLVIMQLIAFGVIRKSYIAYYAALTTISLFQALTATTQAPVYWYGWAMLATSIGYVFLSKFWQDPDFGKPFRVVAQIFVPISVILSLLGFQQFGIWSIGVQLVLAALFYFLCAALMDFDQSPEELNYIMLATTLFPIGFGMALWARDVPHIGVAIIIMTLGALYFVAEKLVPEEKHRPIYGALSALIVFVTPVIMWNEPRQLTILVGVGALLQAAHYVVTRYRGAFTALQITIFNIPSLIGFFLFQKALPLEHIALIMLISSAVQALLAQYVFLPRKVSLADEQDGFAVLGLIAAVVLAFLSGQAAWLTGILFGASAVFAAITLWRSPNMLVGVALSWYLGAVSLAIWLEWSVVAGAFAVLAMSGLVYGFYRLAPNLRNECQLAAVLYGLGIAGAYFAALSSDQPVASLVMAAATLVVAGLSFLERSEEVVLPAAVMSYGAVLHLGNLQDWPVATSLFVWSLVLFAVGWTVSNQRTQLTRWTALVGFGGALFASTDSSVNAWLAVLIHMTAGGAVMAEAYRMKHRIGKYVASVILWSGVLRIYDAAGIEFAQLYIQTTAVYLAALAYRQYQRGERQPQDMLAVGALIVSTVPLAFQALDDKTGGYTLGILGLGLALTVLGMAIHYPLVRTWGIATLVIIVLYKTAGTIFSLPPWVWLGLIGVTTLVGAIYLLSRRPQEENKEIRKKV